MGPKDMRMGKKRMLHNKELHSLYRSPNIIRGIKSSKCRANMDESRSTFKILTGKQTEKRSLGKLRHRWEDNKK